MLSIETLREGYIVPVLNKMGIPFALFTDTGDFEHATREGNTVSEPVNALFTVGNSSTEFAGDEKIVAIPTELKFLVRVNDEYNPDGSFDNIVQFRNALSQALDEMGNKFQLTEDEKTYTVVAVYTFPSSGTRQQFSATGDSFTFTCTVYFTYLSNAINASDIKIKIDGESVPFMSIGFSRRPSIAANLMSENTTGESVAYAENTAFSIDLILPAFVSTLSDVISSYILGTVPANAPHLVSINYNGKVVGKTMIFGESEIAAQGIENASYKISLVPYVQNANIGG